MLSKKKSMVTMVTDELNSRKPHNFTKICGHHWIHLVFFDSRNVYFCTFLCKSS